MSCLERSRKRSQVFSDRIFDWETELIILALVALAAFTVWHYYGAFKEGGELIDMKKELNKMRISPEIDCKTFLSPAYFDYGCDFQKNSVKLLNEQYCQVESMVESAMESDDSVYLQEVIGRAMNYPALLASMNAYKLERLLNTSVLVVDGCTVDKERLRKYAECDLKLTKELLPGENTELSEKYLRKAEEGFSKGAYIKTITHLNAAVAFSVQDPMGESKQFQDITDRDFEMKKDLYGAELPECGA